MDKEVIKELKRRITADNLITFKPFHEIIMERNLTTIQINNDTINLSYQKGLTLNVINKIRTDKTSIVITHLARLCQAYDLTLDQVVRSKTDEELKEEFIDLYKEIEEELNSK